MFVMDPSPHEDKWAHFCFFVFLWLFFNSVIELFFDLMNAVIFLVSSVSGSQGDGVTALLGSWLQPQVSQAFPEDVGLFLSQQRLYIRV